jgi:BlaI family penicillinase repressor
MDEIKAGLSDAEREALNALWDREPGTIRQVLELIEARGRHWAYSTVATLLRRLESKGYATSGGTL